MGATVWELGCKIKQFKLFWKTQNLCKHPRKEHLIKIVKVTQRNQQNKRLCDTLIGHSYKIFMFPLGFINKTLQSGLLRGFTKCQKEVVYLIVNWIKCIYETGL